MNSELLNLSLFVRAIARVLWMTGLGPAIAIAVGARISLRLPLGEISRHARAGWRTQRAALQGARARQAEFLPDRIPGWAAGGDQQECAEEGPMRSTPVTPTTSSRGSEHSRKDGEPRSSGCQQRRTGQPVGRSQKGKGRWQEAERRGLKFRKFRGRAVSPANDLRPTPLNRATSSPRKIRRYA